MPPTAPTPTRQTSAVVSPTLFLLFLRVDGDGSTVDWAVDVGIGISVLLSGEIHDAPPGEIAVAAVVRLAENALEHMTANRLEKIRGAGEFRHPPAFEIAEHGIFFAVAELAKVLAESAARAPLDRRESLPIHRQA